MFLDQLLFACRWCSLASMNSLLHCSAYTDVPRLNPCCMQVVFTRQYDQLSAVLPQGPAERLLEVLMASLEVSSKVCGLAPMHLCTFAHMHLCPYGKGKCGAHHFLFLSARDLRCHLTGIPILFIFHWFLGVWGCCLHHAMYLRSAVQQLTSVHRLPK